MLCQNCKINESTIHLYTNVNGRQQQVDLLSLIHIYPYHSFHLALMLLAVLPNGEDLLIWHAPNAWDPKHYHRDRIGKTNGIPHENKQSHLDRSSSRLEVANEMLLYIAG